MNVFAFDTSKHTMKITRLQLIALAGAVCGVFAAGFLAGGTYASTRAVRTDNTASLMYFACIHEALERQDYARAAILTNTAVDSHVGVLQQLAAGPWPVRSFYALPWTQTQDSATTGDILSHVRRSYEGQPQQLQADTRGFLVAHR